MARDRSLPDNYYNRDVHEVYMRMKDLPSFHNLSKIVKQIVKNSSWIEKYGLQWMIVGFTIPMVTFGFYLMSHQNVLAVVAGMFLMGCAHHIICQRMGHLASHGAMCDSPMLNRFIMWLTVDVCAAYSSVMGINVHIKSHHPHTNIIGLGDSSSWKLPSLSCYQYMFFAPFLIPIATPIVSTYQLITEKLWKDLALFIPTAAFGLVINVYMYVYFSNFTWIGGMICMFLARGSLSVPYIHINIFQHIGLAMYDQKYRPHRVYQMATSVLNLYTNPMLNLFWGPTLIECHVEHHLFPRLSDGMCRKIKPTVEKFLKENNLPYIEDSYYNRLKIFINNYEELMVNAPPITRFVGIQ